MKHFALGLHLFLFSLSPNLFASTALILHATANPATTRYEDYLKIKSLAEKLEASPAAPTIHILFASGIQSLPAAPIADVLQIDEAAENPVEKFVPGVLPSNQPVNLQNVKKSLEEGSKVKEPLFLFLSGESFRKDSEICLRLWDFPSLPGSSELSQICLSDLASQLASRDRPTTVIADFCGSAEIHQLAIGMDGIYPRVRIGFCGFSAMPEIDRDFSCQAGKKDLVLSTSDYFLWKWYQAMDRSGFVRRDGMSLSENQIHQLRIHNPEVDGVSESGYLRKKEFYVQQLRSALEDNPTRARDLQGSILDLQRASSQMQSQVLRSEKELQAARDGLINLQKRLMKSWNLFVRSGKSGLLPRQAQLEIEFFSSQEAAEHINGVASLFEMAKKSVVAPEEALEIGNYRSQRYGLALNWAFASVNGNLYRLALQIQMLEEQVNRQSRIHQVISQRASQIRQVLFSRQILSAWKMITEIHEERALAELATLQKCESTEI